MQARSKLNIVGTLICQTLMDFEINHEEYKTIINEEENSRRLKENIAMMKGSDVLNEKKLKPIKLCGKIIKMHKNLKENFFSFYKMIDINADTYAENCVHTINVVKKR